MNESTSVYVVVDICGEYLRANGTRTTASFEAHEFLERDVAEAACERATDRVVERVESE